MAKPDPRHPLVKAVDYMASNMLADLGGDHVLGRQLQAEVTRLGKKAEALDAVRARRNPTETPAAHALKVSKLARAFDAEIAQAKGRLTQSWGAGVSEVYRRIEDKANLKPDAFAGEIRTRLSQMSAKDRDAQLKRWIDENRGPELAAITKAPPMLSGLSGQETAMWEAAHIERHAASDVAEAKALDEVYAIITSATKAVGDFARELTDPETIAAIESGAAAADAASDAYSAIQ